MTVPILVYRDQLLPRSETFIPRQYRAFTRLAPLWIGTKKGPGAAMIEGKSQLLGTPLQQMAFKQWGRIPGDAFGLANYAPRLIHAHFGRGGALALPLARHFQIPLVVSFWGGDATKQSHYRRRPLLPTIYQRRFQALQAEAALFICVSAFIRDVLVDRGFPPEKLSVLHSGIDVSKPLPAAPPDITKLLFVGRLVEKKGVALLIEAVARLRPRHPTLTLDIIGDGPLRSDLERQARAVGNINFLGWQSNDEVQERMREAGILVVPSLIARDGDAEGLPTVIVEAMAAGCVVVASKSAGIAEAVISEKTGLLFPAGKVEALVARLDEVLASRARWENLREAARRRAESDFEAGTQSRRLEEMLIERLPSPRRLPSPPHRFAAGPPLSRFAGEGAERREAGEGSQQILVIKLSAL
ncbi:MAG TPA: glycosyltransferase, partial [Stellaceae bacterium]|nr:glycosyltransferase [Stellaceae bacterium]